MPWLFLCELEIFNSSIPSRCPNHAQTRSGNYVQTQIRVKFHARKKLSLFNELIILIGFFRVDLV